MVKSCFLSKIFDAASYLPARDLPVAALLVLRRRAVAADCPLPPADFGCGLPRCVSAVKKLSGLPQS
jgi:hypothetical protein